MATIERDFAVFQATLTSEVVQILSQDFDPDLAHYADQQAAALLVRVTNQQDSLLADQRAAVDQEFTQRRGRTKVFALRSSAEEEDELNYPADRLQGLPLTNSHIESPWLPLNRRSIGHFTEAQSAFRNKA